MGGVLWCGVVGVWCLVWLLPVAELACDVVLVADVFDGDFGA